ncbi:MAG: lytic polysaccharide monooxygenase [Planctomycetes bacterium]|nr:lytic polysaccharide monooxygenase [Planctomycetota bacterium]
MRIRSEFVAVAASWSLLGWSPPPPLPHGTVVSPASRVWRVYQANPANPNFPLAANAVAIDGQLSYYTWNELSRNIPQAVQAGLPPGFDYSPWVPDGQLASGGRVDPASTQYPRTYAGLDQVSQDWPTTPVTAGQAITVDFHATAPHDPSVWDVWMTTPDWRPTMPLTWGRMQFLGRPRPVLSNGHYTFPLQIPADRVGHHVLWVAWQRNDPVGEVFFTTSDLMVRPQNDDCGGASVLAAGVHGPFSTRGASPSAGGTACQANGLHDVWFAWDAPCAGTLRVDTCSSGAVDTVVSILQGSCGALLPLVCSDDACGLRSAVMTTVASNTRYWLRVATRGGAGDFTLSLAMVGGPIGSAQASGCAGNAPLSLAVTGIAGLGGAIDVAMVGATGGLPMLVFGLLPTTQPLLPTCGCQVLTNASFWQAAPTTRVTIPCVTGLIGLQVATQGIELGAGSPACRFPLASAMTDVWTFTVQ